MRFTIKRRGSSFSSSLLFSGTLLARPRVIAAFSCPGSFVAVELEAASTGGFRGRPLFFATTTGADSMFAVDSTMGGCSTMRGRSIIGGDSTIDCSIGI